MIEKQSASSATIEFVNHASVLLSDGQTGVLIDPWYFGATFHMGWSLLVESDDIYIREVLSRTTHIWISHEHPDHFSPPFFKRYKDLILAHGITMLFQKTRDQRVADFLRQNGFAVIEMKDGAQFELSSGFVVRTVKSDLYDSALLAEVDGTRVFNLNDCPLTSKDDLEAFVQKYGQCDVLLTQFSYAAWKGGRTQRAWRERAAQAKLRAMQRQITALKPKACIPFASFVRFSHGLNAYMNDAVNQPRQVLSKLKSVAPRLVFMQPGEVQALTTLRPDAAAVDYWQARFTDIATATQAEYESVMPTQLETDFRAWQARSFTTNSRSLMWLASRLLPFHPFAPTVVRLLDQDRLLHIDIFGALGEVENNCVADIELHSASLAFMFRFDFGFDTLFVNGCFEELRPGGFDRFAKCFALGNLNAMGLYIGPAIFRRLDVVRLMLGKLLSVRKNMASAS